MTIVLFAGAEQIDFDYDEVGDEEIFISLDDSGTKKLLYEINYLSVKWLALLHNRIAFF